MLSILVDTKIYFNFLSYNLSALGHWGIGVAELIETPPADYPD